MTHTIATLIGAGFITAIEVAPVYIIWRIMGGRDGVPE